MSPDRAARRVLLKEYELRQSGYITRRATAATSTVVGFPKACDTLRRTSTRLRFRRCAGVPIVMTSTLDLFRRDAVGAAR